MKNMYISVLVLLMALLPSWTFSQRCFSLRISDTEATIGDTVKVDVIANGITDLLSMQYTHEWDPEELDLARVDSFGIPGLTEASFGILPELNAQGKMTFSWLDTDALDGVTLADGTVLYSMHFIVKTIKEERTFIRFSNTPAPFEAVNKDFETGFLPDFYLGAIHLKFANQAFIPLHIEATCQEPTSCEGEGGQIALTVSGGLEPYSFSWSGPGGYTSNLQNPINLDAGTYSVTVQDADGTQTFADLQVRQGGQSWQAALGIECFANKDSARLTAVLFGGVEGEAKIYAWSDGQVDTSTAFSINRMVPLSGVYDVTISTLDGCSYTSTQLKPAEICEDQQDVLFLKLTDVAVAQSGDRVIMPLTVEGFNDITQLSFSLEWDTPALKLISNSLAPSLSDAIVNTETGGLSFTWTSNTGVSFNAEEAILFLEFEANYAPGKPGVRFTDDPSLLSATGTGQNAINVTGQGADLIVLDVAEVTLSIANTTVEPGEQVCIPVSASTFEDIVGAQFQIAWDTAAFIYTDVQNIALPGDNGNLNFFGIEEVFTDGKLKFSWVQSDLSGFSLAPNARLFDLCLTSIGGEDTTRVGFDTIGFPIELINSNLVLLNTQFNDGTVSVLQNVWPGDANLSGVVDHTDLFNIGLGFGRKGPARPEASTNWSGQFAIPWEQKTPGTGLDYRFADSNGDGEINEMDVPVILQNWRRTHAINNPPGAQVAVVRQEGAPLYVELDTLYEGASIDFPIYYGTEETPAQNVYALAFTLRYDASVVKPESIDLNFEDSWLSEQEGDLITIFKATPAEGRIDVAISRTDGRSLNGFGIIGRSAITIEDVIFGVRDSKDFIIEVDEVRVIDAQENPGTVNPRTTTTVIESASSVVNLLESSLITVFPNPANDDLQVSISNSIEAQQLFIYDLNGRVIDQIKLLDQRMDLDISQYHNGFYTIKILAEEGVVVKKVLIKH